MVLAIPVGILGYTISTMNDRSHKASSGSQMELEGWPEMMPDRVSVWESSIPKRRPSLGQASSRQGRVSAWGSSVSKWRKSSGRLPPSAAGGAPICAMVGSEMKGKAAMT